MCMCVFVYLYKGSIKDIHLTTLIQDKAPYKRWMVPHRENYLYIYIYIYIVCTVTVLSWIVENQLTAKIHNSQTSILVPHCQQETWVHTQTQLHIVPKIYPCLGELTCMHVCVCVDAFVCVCVCVDAFVCACVSVCICVCLTVWTCLFQ